MHKRVGSTWVATVFAWVGLLRPSMLLRPIVMRNVKVLSHVHRMILLSFRLLPCPSFLAYCVVPFFSKAIAFGLL